jgi:hypothetical protein
MMRKLIILVFCLIFLQTAYAWENFTLNPYFELNALGEEDLTERTFDDCLGWTYWCSDTTYVAPCEDRPPARMMAIVGEWEQCSIWQDDWADYYLEGNTEYIFEVDLRNVDGCEQVQIVIEDEGYNYEINSIFDITDEWETYSILMDTTEFVDFVGMRVGVAVRVFDADGGSLAATNLRFHINWNDWAWDPYPEMGATQVPLDVTLEWNMGEADPNHLINPDIRMHYFYLSSGDPNDPNAIYLDAVEADPLEPRASYGPLSLEPDKTYYWVIEEGLDDGAGGVYPPGSPENIAGQLWAFDTIKSYPDIITQPQDALVAPGGTAEFVVTVTSPTQEHYQWYMSEDDVISLEDDIKVGSDSNVYQWSNVQVGDETFFYCVITNDATIPIGTKDPTYTEVVKLGVKYLMAHYTLDSSDYSGGLYLDTTGNYNATVEGIPVFVAGMDGTIDGAVDIDPNSGGWANAGVWDPSVWTDEVGLSLWVKYDGSELIGDGPGLIAKRDLSDIFRWSLYTRGGDGSHSGDNWLRFTSWNGGDVWVGPDALPVDVWTHVAATVNGNTARVYINGIEAASGWWAFGLEVDDPIYIGQGMTADWLYPGALDDVRIYSYGLDKFEVADIFSAVTDENVCVDDYASEWDTNEDCKINIEDFATVAGEWLKCGLYPSCL